MERTMGKHRYFFKDESVSAAVDYRLLVVMIAMVIIAASIATMSKTLSALF
jgi:Flp pilus assembly pilin Flp